MTMPFQKNNKQGFTSDEPLDREPICFKGKVGQKEKLANIPNWQKRFREFIDIMAEEKPS